MSDETPFRLRLYFANGDEREFPIYLDPARESVRRAVLWDEHPIDPEVADKLDDRRILLQATLRVYTALARRGEGTYHLDDVDDNSWGILARTVVAVRMHDPEAPQGKRGRTLGFTVEE